MTTSTRDQPMLPFRDPLGVDAMGGRIRGKVDTSRAAAFDGLSRVTKDRRRVLAYITSTGVHGAIQDEVSAGLLMHHGTASARFKELRDAAFIVRTPHRRRTRSGSTAAVHRATLKGQEALRLSLAIERGQAAEAAARGSDPAEADLAPALEAEEARRGAQGADDVSGFADALVRAGKELREHVARAEVALSRPESGGS